MEQDNIWLNGIMGLVTGDALGNPVQFSGREVIRMRKIGPVTGMESGGVFHTPAGTWTDDSSMTLATLDSIREIGSVVPSDIMLGFVSWLKNGAYTPFGKAFDQGITCSDAIKNFEKTKDWETCGKTGEMANGNGALMRILPICLHFVEQEQNGDKTDIDKVIDAIDQVTALTHNHLRAKIGSGLYYFLVREVILGEGSLMERLQRGMDKGHDYYSKDILNLPEFSYYGRMLDLTLLNLLRPDIVIDKETFRTMAEPNAYINNLLRVVRAQSDGWQDASREEIARIMATTWGRNVIQHNPVFEQIYDFLDKDTVTRDERIEMITKIESLHSFHSIINRTRRKDIEDFCIRRNLTVKVPYTSAQRDLYDALIEFEATSLAMLHGSQSVRFMMCTIMRQAASCIYGLQPFMKDIIARRIAQIQEDGELYEHDVELNSDDENYLFELSDRIERLSEQLPEEDPKYDKLYDIICEKQREENNRVIIFSSFRHTLVYIRKKLEKRGIRVGQVDGSVPDTQDAQAEG